MENTRVRFNIVVFNYNRLHLFLDNFNKIQNFRKGVDRITIVSGSPSDEELNLIRSFEKANGVAVEYLPRKNRGIDQFARVEFFLGDIGSRAANLNADYIFQMQEHYLDTTSDHSRWGENLDYRIKGDVVPDDIVFDLDEIDLIFKAQQVSTCFCDRNDPCLFTVRGKNHIAPNGGNFILKTGLLFDAGVTRKIKFLKKTFNDNYRWAVFAEFFWGEIFFVENSGSFDYKRKRLFMSYSRDDFYISPDDYSALRNKYIYLYKKQLRALSYFLKSQPLLKVAKRLVGRK